MPARFEVYNYIQSKVLGEFRIRLKAANGETKWLQTPV